MPAKARRYDDAAVRAALAAQWRLVLPAYDAAVATTASASTRLPGWDVERLGAHLTGTVRRLVAALDRPEPGRAGVTLTDYYANDEPAPDPAYGLTDAIAEAEVALTAAPPARAVMVGEGPMRLTDYLVTRVVEAVVHGLDLPDPVAPDRGALGITVRVLADLLAAREPGRTVEVRVPPYAAVQCVGGPVHTRGTPPNVVEADPVAWVEVATGRRPWDAAVAAGQVTASGSRADLSPYLPLL